MPEILIIDDDRFLADSVRQLLAKEGFGVRKAHSAEEGYQLISEEQPNLLILDLSLPDQDGVSLCRRLRARWHFPILMLTSRTNTIDKVVGLEVGADDYLTKPFDGQELLSRVRAQLRRVSEYLGEPGDQAKPVEIGGLTIDRSAREVRVAGTGVDLTETEFKIIDYLASNRGRAISREQLFDEVWGYELEFSSNTLDVLIYRLRQKLEAVGCPPLIKTMRGYGYKLESE
jgi:DNA-binding response OmpR family regulator